MICPFSDFAQSELGLIVHASCYCFVVGQDLMTTWCRQTHAQRQRTRRTHSLKCFPGSCCAVSQLIVTSLLLCCVSISGYQLVVHLVDILQLMLVMLNSAFTCSLLLQPTSMIRACTLNFRPLCS